MNKNNYYYKKLAQSIIFGEIPWEQIVDFEDSHDNVYKEEFLTSLYALLIFYQKKACLESGDVKRLQTFLSDIRFTYPYQSRTEKEEVFSIINEMIRMSNEISDSGVSQFYLEEYQKRYGVYVSTKIGKLVRGTACCLFCELEDIKQDLSQDIYPLTLLYHEISELTDEHIEKFLLADCFLSTINALQAENPEILKDSLIRERFLYILRRNEALLMSNNYISSGNKNDDRIFKRHNKFVLKRLEKINK